VEESQGMKTFIQHINEVRRTTGLLSTALAASIGISAPTMAASPVSRNQTTQQTYQNTTAWKILISKYEGFKTEAYWDETGKVWTIGKGSTTHPDGRPVKKGDKITKQQADQYMEHYVNTKVIPKLKMIPNWNLMNSNQQSALISFAYNVGPGFYGKEGFESITKALSSSSNWKDVPSALAKYIKSKGKILPGLIKRRKAEGDLWLKANG
jgi:GH24 family phage-related lysozyme (muramidase)